MSLQYIEGDALQSLRSLPDGSVNCCITSPPYYGLRRYLPIGHTDAALEIGTERTPEEFIGKLVEVFREVRRVLRDDGTLFINVGDSYFSGGMNPSPSPPPGRAHSCGSDDTGPQDSLEIDSACHDLCDECRAVLSGHRSESSAQMCSSSSLLGEKRGHGNGHLDFEPGVAADAPLCAPESTSRESSAPPLGECSHCSNCGACLSVLRSSSRDASLCARKAGYTSGIVQRGLARHSLDKGVLDSAFLYSTTASLKPKDLIGIPWMLAFALRQPYYAGKIKNIQDRVWLAAMMDGEGCFYIHRRKAGQHAGDGYFRQNDNFAPALEVANTSERIIHRCMEIAGCGSIIRQDKDRRQPLYRWTARCDEARILARELHPFLVAKQQQARIVCGVPSTGERAEAGWLALKSLHAGILSEIDFPTPPDCLEPGFYLRQDIIWSKPNPMPESVKDRCTKAHEYVFLLSKSQRYHYDADAIGEQSVRGYAGSNFNTGKTARHQLQRSSEKEREDSGMRNKRSVWTITTRATPEAHFATFPLELPELCLKAGCPEGGTVLDPFAGAGTTGLACLKNGRKFVGIELNPSYIEIALARARKYYPLLVETAS